VLRHVLKIASGVVLLYSSISFATCCDVRHKSIGVRFQHIHACPSTGKTIGSCPGWVKDHIIPLCGGGKDAVDNLQWQTVEEAKQKDQREKVYCKSHSCK
jgi:5-methylcytosine-specific restriction endonuclease McrA